MTHYIENKSVFEKNIFYIIFIEKLYLFSKLHNIFSEDFDV